MNWKQFKILFSNSIRLDFRSRWHAEQQKKKRSPIIRSLIFYTLMGASLSVSLASQATPDLYTILMLSYSMVMMAFAVILEFGQSIISPDDWHVLSFRPVSSRTYFIAKLANLLFFIVIIGSALTILPALSGSAIAGTRPLYPVIFYFVALFANLFSAACVVFFYTLLLKIIPYQKFKDMLAYLQIGFAFVIFLVYQMIPRLVQNTSTEITESMNGVIGYLLPPAWFAALVRLISNTENRMDFQISTLGLGVTLCFVFFAFRRISLNYAGLIAESATEESKHSAKTARTTEPADKIRKTDRKISIIRNQESAAGFSLASRMLKYDRSVKTGIYPLMGFPLAFLFLDIVGGGLSDPFVSKPFSDGASSSGIVPLFVFFMVYSVVTNLQYTKDWKGGWIFQLAPIGHKSRLNQGVRLAVLIRLIVPFFLVFGLIYCFAIPIVHGVKHMVTLFLISLVVYSFVAFFIKDYPFSRELIRGARSQRFLGLFLVMPFFILFNVIQGFCYDNPFFWWLSVIGLVVLFIILEWVKAFKTQKNRINN